MWASRICYPLARLEIEQKSPTLTGIHEIIWLLGFARIKLM
jgi:hypothetical protein